MITTHAKDNVVSYHRQIITVRTSKNGFNPRITKQNHIVLMKVYLLDPDGNIERDPDGKPLYAGNDNP